MTVTDSRRILATDSDRVEALLEHDRAAGGERDAERDVQPEDVVERQDAERSVVGREPEPGVVLHLRDVRREVAVREHRRLRRARGARREEQDRDVVGGAVDASDRRCIQLVEVDRDDVGARRRQHRRRRSGREREARRDRGQLATELARRCRRVERHGDRADVERCEVRGDERGVVARPDRDAVTGLEATPDELAPQPGGHVGELAVGDGPLLADERRRLGGAATEQHVDDVHRRIVRRPDRAITGRGRGPWGGLGGR